MNRWLINCEKGVQINIKNKCIIAKEYWLLLQVDWSIADKDADQMVLVKKGYMLNQKMN